MHNKWIVVHDVPDTFHDQPRGCDGYRRHLPNGTIVDVLLSYNGTGQVQWRLYTHRKYLADLVNVNTIAGAGEEAKEAADSYIATVGIE